MAESLALYGSLRRGEANHHMLAGVPGYWLAGSVQGRIDRRGRYARYKRDGSRRWPPVEIFISPAMPRILRMLDRFEASAGYRRISVPVRIGGKTRRAYIYEAAR